MITKNEVTLIGNLGGDAELITFENGDQIVTFSLATNKEYTDKSGQPKSITTWHNVVLKGKQVAFAKEHLKKGMLVYVNGELRNRPYNKDSKISITEIVGVAYAFDIAKREDSSGEQGWPA